jgi:Flp pilus assembly pilin Flp
MKALLCRWLADDEGKNLVEYALLSAIVALGSFVAVSAIGAAINAAYASWDAAAQALWQPQDPAN